MRSRENRYRIIGTRSGNSDLSRLEITIRSKKRNRVAEVCNFNSYFFMALRASGAGAGATKQREQHQHMGCGG